MTEIFYECPTCEGLVNSAKLEFIKDTKAGEMLNTRIKLTCEKGHVVEWNL